MRERAAYVLAPTKRRTGRSAIGTLVERSSRSAILVHLPRLEGWGEKPYVKNGPSLGGYGAAAMNAALTASITTTLPQQLRKTLTWDRGKELSGHAQFALETGTRVFFAVANLAKVGRGTLYRDPQLRAVINEYRAHQADARTLTGLASEITHLRTALEAVADNVKRHEEQLRRLQRQTRRQTR